MLSSFLLASEGSGWFASLASSLLLPPSPSTDSWSSYWSSNLAQPPSAETSAASVVRWPHGLTRDAGVWTNPHNFESFSEQTKFSLSVKSSGKIIFQDKNNISITWSLYDLIKTLDATIWRLLLDFYRKQRIFKYIFWLCNTTVVDCSVVDSIFLQRPFVWRTLGPQRPKKNFFRYYYFHSSSIIHPLDFVDVISLEESMAHLN